jgi:hypothetical protein
VVPTQRGCGSLSNSGPRTSHRQLQRSLDWKGRVCSLDFQVTWPHTIGFLPTGLHEIFDLLIVRQFWSGSRSHQANYDIFEATRQFLLPQFWHWIEANNLTFEYLL